MSTRQLQQEPCFPGSASCFAHSPHIVILTWGSSHHPASPRPQPTLKSVPCSGLISTASPCMWPLMLHGHLKLNRSETTHFQTLKTAFLSCVPSHTWEHQHPPKPQVSTPPRVLDQASLTLHSPPHPLSTKSCWPCILHGCDPFPLPPPPWRRPSSSYPHRSKVRSAS